MNLSWDRLRRNILASLVVAILGLPMSAGIAVISGAPIITSILSTAVAGILIATLGAIPLQVIGPGVSLAVIIAPILATEGAPGLAQMTFLAGLVQLLLAATGWVIWASKIRRPVLDGMLASVGVSLLCSQIPMLWAASGPQGRAQTSFGLGLAVLLILLGWRALGLERRCPGAIVAVLAGSGLAFWLHLEVPVMAWAGHAEGWHFGPAQLLHWPSLQVFWLGLGTGVLTSAQTALSAASLVPGAPPPSPAALRRQVGALGLTNLACALCGGVPVTAVVARSAANVQAGASSRLSVGLSGVWAGLLLLGGGTVLQYLPLTCLAAVFIVLATELMPLAALREAFSAGQLFAYLTTLLASVRLNIFMGVGLGLLVTGATQVTRRLRLRRPLTAKPITGPRSRAGDGCFTWHRNSKGRHATGS